MIATADCMIRGSKHVQSIMGHPWMEGERDTNELSRLTKNEGRNASRKVGCLTLWTGPEQGNLCYRRLQQVSEQTKSQTDEYMEERDSKRGKVQTEAEKIATTTTIFNSVLCIQKKQLRTDGVMIVSNVKE